MTKSLLSSLAVLTLALPIGGCGSSPPISSSSGTVNEQPWRELKSKMDTMTPEQRAQYIREHPDEFAALGKIETPPPAGPVPPTSR